MKRALFILVGVVLGAVAFACLWDRDTLAAELEGLPGVADLVAGRVDRNPDLYYEMRIERVLREHALDPTRLELYDDLGVAYDRLGDHDSAIAWMENKAIEIENQGIEGAAWDEAEYKRLANVGTFRIHKWLREGADREDVSLLEEGKVELERAIEINPDAHFGREAIQVAFVEAMLNPADAETIFKGLKEEEGHERFLEGVLGIMVLGDAWQSVDAFQLLKAGLDYKDGVTAYLINQKIEDLESEGKVGMLEFVEFGVTQPSYQVQGQENEVERAYAALIKNGDEYRNNRTEFLLAKLESGKHPDTDADFWEGYEAVSPVDIGSFAPLINYKNQTLFQVLGAGLVVIGIPVLVLVFGAIYLEKRWRKRREGQQL